MQNEAGARAATRFPLQVEGAGPHGVLLAGSRLTHFGLTHCGLTHFGLSRFGSTHFGLTNFALLLSPEQPSRRGEMDALSLSGGRVRGSGRPNEPEAVRYGWQHGTYARRAQRSRGARHDRPDAGEG